MIKSYRDLDVWQRSRALVKHVYDLTRLFPREEMYGLTSQIRRASISVPSNIAEGHSRSGTKDYIHFLSISIGSLAELETQVLLAEDLEYVKVLQTEEIIKEIITIQKMLYSLRMRLREKLNTPIPNPNPLVPA